MNSKLRVLGKYAVFISFSMGLKFFLDLSYHFFLSQIPFYQPYFQNSFEIQKLVPSYMGLLLTGSIFFLVIYINVEKSFVFIVITVLYYINFIPALTFYQYGDIREKYFFVLLMYWLILLITASALEKKQFRISLKNKTLKLIHAKYDFFFLLGMLFALICLISIIVHGKVNLSINFKNVYELRKTAKLSTELNIISFWCGGVLIPYVTYKCILEKRYLFAVAGYCVQILSFSIAGMKTELFIIPCTIIFTYIADRKKYWTISGSFIIIIGTGIAEYFRRGSFFILDYIVTRIFFFPSFLNYKYFEYFSGRPKLLGSEDIILERLYFKILGMDRPYEMFAGSLIGNKYFTEGMYANTGLNGYAYADFGIAGVIISAVLLAVLLKLIETGLSKLKHNYMPLLAVICCISLVSVSINNFIYLYCIPMILIFLIERKKDEKRSFCLAHYIQS